ncbi:MAG: hypothetical protein WCC17_22350 [Candidatus Nitrosopolaris sp.]
MNAHQSIEENVLFTEKEEIELSKSSAKILAADLQDPDVSNPEYVFGNEDDEDCVNISLFILFAIFNRCYSV